MTDLEALEYIKAHLRDYDKAFGEAKTLLGLWVDYNPELEAWVKDLLSQPKKTFLDDLPEIKESTSGIFEETYDELNESWPEPETTNEEWKDFINE